MKLIYLKDFYPIITITQIIFGSNRTAKMHFKDYQNEFKPNRYKDAYARADKQVTFLNKKNALFYFLRHSREDI
jgi:hypothetical protein